MKKQKIVLVVWLVAYCNYIYIYKLKKKKKTKTKTRN